MSNPITEEEFKEKYCFEKKNVSIYEYKIHKYVYDLNIVNTPKIYSYDKECKIMIMQKINHNCISDMYGEEDNHINDDLYSKIRDIIISLYNENIEYPDITGYNFVEDKDGKIWIIDFEHSRYEINKKNSFVKKFMNGFNGWNPEFK
jgi:tRNA A-37 threonylcarbamoyl transferase component Bud32